MVLCIFEDDGVAHLDPLTLTRAVYDLRIGIRTLAERIEDAFPDAQVILHARRAVGAVTGQEHDRVVNRIPGELDVLFVNGRWFAESGEVLDEIRAATRTREPSLFVQDEVVVAAWVPEASPEIVEEEAITAASFPATGVREIEGARFVSRLWHPHDFLEEALVDDYAHRTRGFNIFERPGATIQDGALLVEGERIFIAPGATVRPGAILNAEDGPIYVDRDAIVMENAVVRGPAYIGPKSQVKMGGLLEACSIGTYCKVGGEVHDAILHSYSAKAHAGFLGHAYLGRWCNIGADTNNSNLKNDYGSVSLYNPVTGEHESTERQFFGLVMGDHSKCGINTMFNTGTVVGVFCNVYGTGFPPRYIPSFSWGTPEGFTEYRLDKALRVAEAVMARRNVTLTEADRELLTHVYETSQRRGDAASV